MGTTNDKMSYLNITKQMIKEAIQAKNVEVSDSDTFRSYANKISSIPAVDINDYFNTTISRTGNNTYYGVKKMPELTITSATTTLQNFLAQFKDLEEVSFSSNSNTSNVTRMDNMFAGCNNLKELDLSAFNTSNVTNMSNMFSSCNNLKELDLSAFNTSNVTNMSGMFISCHNLKELDLSAFNTSNVTNMSAMFRENRALEKINLSGFNTSKVTIMGNTFFNCNKLTSLDCSSFTLDACTDMDSMFNQCTSLQTLDISNMDFGTYGSQITKHNNIFKNVPTNCTIYVKDQASADVLRSWDGNHTYTIKEVSKWK